MAENDETSEAQGGGEKSQLDLAREAGNVWTFNGREIEMFVARGEADVPVSIVNPATQDETGATMIHRLRWQKDAPFIKREGAFKTTLRSVGRSKEQDVDTTQLIPVNKDFYAELIEGATILAPKGNGEFNEIEKLRDDMLNMARLYPESASEVIESWMDAATIKLLGEEDGDSFDWMFTERNVIRAQWTLGDPENPVAAAIISFKSPTSERRDQFDDDVQKIKSEKKGDVKIAKLSESFVKKLQYGAEHLVKVEGIAVGEEGVTYTDALKQKFITLFNPIWFVECVELMHESFDFFKSKSAKN